MQKCFIYSCNIFICLYLVNMVDLNKQTILIIESLFFSDAILYYLLYNAVDSISVNDRALNLKKREIRQKTFVEHWVWLTSYNETEFYNLFRVQVCTFNKLLKVLINSDTNALITKKYPGGNHPTPPEKSLLVFLWYMSKQDTLNAIGDKFGLVPSTVMITVNDILYILLGLKKKFIFWPCSVEELDTISIMFKKYPGTIGAVDGSHIYIKVPNKQHGSYVDRYMRHSINLMGVCTKENLFTYVFIGFPGSAHDSRVFSNSKFVQNIESHEPHKYFMDADKFHLIGDSAFPIRFMTPYKQTHHLSQKESYHNYRLSSDRVVIEHTFGILKGRWKRLQFVNIYNVCKAIEITTAACVLHNFCILNTDAWKGELYNEEHGEFQDNDMIETPDGKSKRNRIATMLNNNQ